MLKKEKMKNVKTRFCRLVALSSVAMMTFASVAGVNKLNVYAANPEIFASQTYELTTETQTGEDKAPTVGCTFTDVSGNDCARLENTLAALIEAGQIKEFPLNDTSGDAETEALAKAMKLLDLDLDGNPDILVFAMDIMGYKTTNISVVNSRNIVGEKTITLNETALSKVKTPYNKEVKFVFPAAHTHKYSDKWTADGAYGHYHNCLNPACPYDVDGKRNSMEGYAAHTYGDWVVDKAATDTAPGKRHSECTVCGYSFEEVIPAGKGDGSSLPDPRTKTDDKKPEEQKTTEQTTTEQTTTEQKTTEQVKKPTEDANSRIVGNLRYVARTKGKKQYAVVTGLYNKKAKSVTIKDSVKINGKTYKVKEISANAFKKSDVKKVVIGKNVTTIGKNAFNGCKNLKSVTIKTTSLKKGSIKSGAFKGLNAQAKIKVPAKKLKTYKSILKSAGFNGKKQKVTK